MKVFISHSHKDQNIADRVARDLEAHIIDVWRGAEQIALGETLVNRISQEIENSNAILVLISKNTDASHTQSSEIAIAIAAQRNDPSKLVIPVLVEQTTHLPFFLEGIAYCDISTEDKYKTNIQNLVDTLLRPPSTTRDIVDLDKRQIEAIEAERDLLAQQIETLTRRRVDLGEQLVRFLAGASAILTFSIVIFYFGLIQWLEKNLGGLAVGGLMGLVGYVVGSLASAIATQFFIKKASRKETKNAKR